MVRGLFDNISHEGFTENFLIIDPYINLAKEENFKIAETCLLIIVADFFYAMSCS